MADDQQVAKGDGNTQIVGDGNISNLTVFQYMPQRPLTHSLIHDLLDVVYFLPASDDDSYSLQLPAKIPDKLQFNNAAKYMRIIDNHTDDYMRVDDVMKEYPNSEDVVKKLRDMFLDVAIVDGEGNPCVGDGDAQLDQIKVHLIDTIVTDSKFDANLYPIETIEEFCIALIAYGVSKCKILVNLA